MEWSKQRRKLSSVQFIVLLYAISIFTSTFILWLPFLHKPGVTLSIIDALFTAVSAISVTGLTVVNTAETFNHLGRFVLLILFQIGGVGVMALGTFLWIILGRSIGLEQRKWIAIDHNRSGLSGLVALMQTILSLALIIEAIGTIILGTYFLAAGYYESWYQAYYYALFASVSAFTNAGFDIFGDSLMQFSEDYFVLILHMTLIILGGIGFPVLIEVKEYLSTYHLKQRFHFSLFTKLTTTIYFGLLLIGTVVFYLLERTGYLSGKSGMQALFHSLFNSVTSRSGGLTIMDINALTEPTQLFLSTLMFIGASPSSVGGGIRTTTFVVVFLVVFAYMKGRTDVKVFRRELHPEDISKALIVFVFAIHLVLGAIFLLMIMETAPLTPIIFEVTSAFGTCGLSMGITSGLSITSKLVLAALMFIGRIGLIPILLLLKKTERKSTYHYPQERIIIG